MAILDKFLRYISIPTNSDSEIRVTPSTDAQWNLAKLLEQELKSIGIDDVYLDAEHCYVYAYLKGIESAPKIGFISHIDTSEEATDININPQIIENYNGESVNLNEEEILDVNKYPDLKNHTGKTLITTDGNTLLGADDKAGIAEIMTMLENIIKNNIEHGDIYIAFTPDEELGEDTTYFDFSKFKADFAYTVDGSDLGEISYENFNAASVNINIKGIITHLGYAKGTLINSQLIANEIINLIPNEFPETTEGYEGYYHLFSIKGDVSNTKMEFIIRDFERKGFENRKQVFYNIVNKLNEKYNNCITIKISDSYYNMSELISQHMHLIENAKQAMENANVTPFIHEIRGGTTGTRLADKKFPCPNLGTGGHNFHGIYEYICLEDMEKTVEVLQEIVKLYGGCYDK